MGSANARVSQRNNTINNRRHSPLLKNMSAISPISTAWVIANCSVGAVSLPVEQYPAKQVLTAFFKTTKETGCGCYQNLTCKYVGTGDSE